MTYAAARTVLDAQHRRMKEWKNVKFSYKGYEYRANYEAGFAPDILLERRLEGTRNFKYFHMIDVANKFSISLDEIKEEIDKTPNYR